MGGRVHPHTHASLGKMALGASVGPMKKSCQDLEKNLGKIFSKSCKLARNQGFRMDLEQESCKIRKILASSKSWIPFQEWDSGYKIKMYFLAGFWNSWQLCDWTGPTKSKPHLGIFL